MWDYASNRWDRILELTLEHGLLILVAVMIAIAVGVVLGVAITYNKTLSRGVLYVCQVMMTIPSMALFGLLIPLLGIGFTTGVTGLVLYSLLPIVRNTYTGIREIDPAILEAARGMGMRERTVLFKIKLPMALPVIMAGIRTATVMVIGIGAIASYVGAGGLGELIFRGISRYHTDMILTGAICVSIVAVAADLLLKLLERRMSL